MSFTIINSSYHNLYVLTKIFQTWGMQTPEGTMETFNMCIKSQKIFFNIFFILYILS